MTCIKVIFPSLNHGQSFRRSLKFHSKFKRVRIIHPSHWMLASTIKFQREFEELSKKWVIDGKLTFNGLQHAKRDIRRFAEIAVSDQPMQAAQANPRRHFTTQLDFVRKKTCSKRKKKTSNGKYDFRLAFEDCEGNSETTLFANVRVSLFTCRMPY